MLSAHQSTTASPRTVPPTTSQWDVGPATARVHMWIGHLWAVRVAEAHQLQRDQHAPSSSRSPSTKSSPLRTTSTSFKCTIALALSIAQPTAFLQQVWFQNEEEQRDCERFGYSWQRRSSICWSHSCVYWVNRFGEFESKSHRWVSERLQGKTGSISELSGF